MRVRAWCAATLVTGLAAFCVSASAGAGAPAMVAEPGQVIRFERRCAAEMPYRVQAYGKFLTDADTPAAQALALVVAGYAGTLAEGAGIGVVLQAVRIRGLEDWADEPFSVALTLSADGHVAAGANADTYHESFPGTPPSVTAFRIDKAGNHDWLTFLEPSDRPDDSPEHRFHRIPPSLFVSRSRMTDPDWRRPLQLDLRLVNAGRGEEIALQGPLVVAPDKIMDSPPPKTGALGLARALNPAEEGGLFRTLFRAAKYRRCIDERRAAKHAFADGASTAGPRSSGF